MKSKSLLYRIYLDCLIGSTLLLSTLAFFAFIAVFAKDEGTLGNNPISVFLADSFIYIFPLVPLLSTPAGGFPMFVIAYGVNVLLYASVIAFLLFHFIKGSEKYRFFAVSNYAFYIVVAIIGFLLLRLFMTAD
jgi:hypothetical protein